MTRNDECIFCKIVAGEIPCYSLLETDNVIAFLDIMPVTHGHLLVIPKEHYTYACEAPPERMGELMAAGTQLAARAHETLHCDGINFIVNCGEKAGQIVPHVHLHVVPRYADDGIEWPWPQGTLNDDRAHELINSLRISH